MVIHVEEDPNLGPDAPYQYAIIFSCGKLLPIYLRKFTAFQIFSRSKVVDKATVDRLAKVAEDLGFDTSGLTYELDMSTCYPDDPSQRPHVLKRVKSKTSKRRSWIPFWKSKSASATETE